MGGREQFVCARQIAQDKKAPTPKRRGSFLVIMTNFKPIGGLFRLHVSFRCVVIFTRRASQNVFQIF
jgi:hypothetical protein